MQQHGLSFLESTRIPTYDIAFRLQVKRARFTIYSGLQLQMVGGLFVEKPVVSQQ